MNTLNGKKPVSTILAVMLCLSVIGLQAQGQQAGTSSNTTDNSDDSTSGFTSSTLLARIWRSKRTGFSLMPLRRTGVISSPARTAASPPAVHGTGTVGRLPLWVETSPAGNSILGDSIITQLNGNIGIGLATPLSKLSVQGMIETTLGGYKFPDGTVQTTAAVSGLQSVTHDSTMTGDGTAASPLGVAVPLTLSSSTSDAILTIKNVCCAGGPSVRAFGGEATGVSGAGNAVEAFGGNSHISLSPAGVGVKAQGGVSGNASGPGGTGVQSVGGFSETQGGKGLVVTGGSSVRPIGGNNAGGAGIFATGGSASSTNLEGDTTGGDGIVATGGNSSGTLFGGSFAGSGVNAIGGTNALGPGGVGVFATGGLSRDGGGFVHQGGVGLVATGGSGDPPGRAALFRGDVDINGNLDVSGPAGGGNITATGSKNFKIDHPLDPENKYLLHASIESSEVLNVYSGNVITNATGEAVVTLPDWFEALNRDLRYQLTVIGAFAQAMVANEVKNNQFTIRTNAPNVKVSWQVTGVRSDAMMRIHPFRAVEDKPERERGAYLTPELFGKPEERGVAWARNPEMMQKLKQQRLEAQRVGKQGGQIGRLIP